MPLTDRRWAGPGPDAGLRAGSPALAGRRPARRDAHGRREVVDADRPAGPRPPDPRRHRRERASRPHRRGRRRRPDRPRPRRPGPARHPPLDGQAVRPRRPHRGGRRRGVRPVAGRDRDHGLVALGRGPPRPDDPGALPAGRRHPDRCSPAAPRACRSMRSPPPGSPATGSGHRRSATCARASTRSSSCSPGSAIGPSRRTGSRPPGPRGLPERGRPGLRGRSPTPPDGGRRLRRPDLRLPAPRGGPGLCAPGRPGGRPGGRPAGRARPAPHDRSATRCSPIPRWSAGTRERLDTSLMKALPGRIVSKSGMEALRGDGDPAGSARDRRRSPAAPGSPSRSRTATATSASTWAATVEALRQAGVLEGQPLRELARYHRPASARSARTTWSPRRSPSSTSRRSASCSPDRLAALGVRPGAISSGDRYSTAMARPPDPFERSRSRGVRPSTRSRPPTAGWPSSTTPIRPVRRHCPGSSPSRPPTSR